MHIKKEEVLQNIETLDLPDDIRDAYKEAFSRAPEKMIFDDVERLTEETLERNWDPDGRINAYVPANELIYGRNMNHAPSVPEVRTRLLEAVLKNEMPEDNFNVRGTFMKVLKGITGNSRKIDQSQLEQAFAIASGHSNPPAQEDYRKGCERDIEALRKTLQQVMPAARIA